MLIIVYFDMKYVPIWRCPTPPKIHELNVENNTLEIKSFQKYSQSIFLMNYRSILLFSELILVIFFLTLKQLIGIRYHGMTTVPSALYGLTGRNLEHKVRF